MNLKINFFRIFFSNINRTIINGLLTFLIPKFIGTLDYGIYKSFLLYVSYMVFTPLGFIDGISVKYVNKSNHNNEQFKIESNFFFYKQLFILIIFLSLTKIINNDIYIYIIIYNFLFNMIALFSYYYQATSRFNEYLKINSFIPLFNLIFSCISIFIFDNKTALTQIIVLLLANSIIFIFLFKKEFKFVHITKIIKNFQSIKNIYMIGLPVLVSNYLSLFFINLDKIVVQRTYGYEDFAFYAFAVSAMSIIQILVNSLSIVIYPYIANTREKIENINFVKKGIVVFSSITLNLFFVIKILIVLFIPEYLHSLDILAIYFLTILPFMKNKMLTVNFYKVNLNQKNQIKNSVIVIFLGITMYFIGIKFNLSISAIAFISVFLTYVWDYYMTKEYLFLRISKEEVFIYAFSVICFILNVFLVKNIYMNLFLSFTAIVGIVLINIKFIKELFKGAHV